MSYILELNGTYLYEGKEVIVEWFDDKTVWGRMETLSVEFPISKFENNAQPVRK
jgi:hypothetical protein